jgi:NAD(P) transhydrogenase subunit beta
MRAHLIDLAYLVASILFISCLRGLSAPEKGRRGLFFGELGMLIAVVATLAKAEVVRFEWIAVGLLVGSTTGIAISARLPMTKMPERIAFSHAFGGLATALVGIAEFHRHRPLFAPEKTVAVGARAAHALHPTLDRLTAGALGFEVFLGALTFTGSIVAFGKLQGILPGAPITYRGQNASNIGAFALAIVLVLYLVADPTGAPTYGFLLLGGLGLVLGVLGVIPIGGADMPVVISLLNSYAGLAACATGFALGSNVLIICGALDGSSGLLLSMLMSKAMNRSFANVLFGAFGTGDSNGASAHGAPGRSYNEATVEDAAAVLQAAQMVIIVPGYGMAVSQAQHAVRDLCAVLEKRGTEVKYAIHPVAGRMPGHMNVLLAEANIPYDQLYDLDMINDDFGRADAVLVVGANDVVNPAAKTDPKSPIFGMPVFNVDQAKSVIVLKRSMNTGFSGVENELFFQPNTMMVLGDAKKTLVAFVHELKGGDGH